MEPGSQGMELKSLYLLQNPGDSDAVHWKTVYRNILEGLRITEYYSPFILFYFFY